MKDMEKEFSEGFMQDLADLLQYCMENNTDSVELGFDYDKTYINIEEAIKAWNTRKPMARILERLEDDIADNPDASLGNYRAGLYKAIEIVKEEGAVE